MFEICRNGCVLPVLAGAAGHPLPPPRLPHLLCPARLAELEAARRLLPPTLQPRLSHPTGQTRVLPAKLSSRYLLLPRIAVSGWRVKTGNISIL